MNKIALIIGYGSAGQRHARLLKKNKKISKIYIFSSSVNFVENINRKNIVIPTLSGRFFFRTPLSKFCPNVLENP